MMVTRAFTDAELADHLDVVRSKLAGFDPDSLPPVALGFIAEAANRLRSKPTTEAPAAASEPSKINGTPPTARSLLEALIDIHDDSENNAPEDRSYVDSAWRDILAASRTFLTTPTAAPAPAQVPSVDAERLRHSANEWADAATTALQWLRNIRDGISTPREAIANVKSSIAHCRDVDAEAKKP